MHSIPQPEQGVFTVAMPGEDVLLLQQDTGKYYSLNQTASLIWKMMESPTCNADIVHALVDRFDISAEAADSALREFLEELHSQNLIKSSPARTL